MDAWMNTAREKYESMDQSNRVEIIDWVCYAEPVNCKE